MKNLHKKALAVTFLLSVSIMMSSAFAADKNTSSSANTASAPSDAPADANEAVDVSKLSEKYWAQGKDTELGVVQNRKYTSSHKLELNVFGSVISTSPFLDVHAIGGSVGYNFNQYVSLHAVAWKSSVSNSEAYNTFKQQAPTANVYTNNPSGFYGLQTNYNFLYGKASLFGDVIIYVDVFLLGGLGFTTTDSGSDFTPFVGIGQKVHLNKWLALSLDYRVMRFNESLYNRTTPSATYVGSRTNTTDAITLGFSFFL